MVSNPPSNPSASARPSPATAQQPFPGAVSAASSAPQPRRTVMEIPAPLPRPSFIFRTDGGYSNDAKWVFEGWGTQIGQHISANTTKPDVNDIEKPRSFMLAEACKKHDILYIIMHQRYCTWSRDKEAAYALLHPYSRDAIDNGFGALAVLLKSNDDLPGSQLEWFCQFPATSFDAYIPSPIMASITKDIVEFLIAFAAHWQELRVRILARGFPILVWELAHTLRCSSYMAQYLTFTLSRRILGCPDGHFSSLCGEIFAIDRNFEMGVASNSVPPEHIEPTRNDVTTASPAVASQSVPTAAARAPVPSQPIQSPMNPATPRLPSGSESVVTWHSHSPQVRGPQTATNAAPANHAMRKAAPRVSVPSSASPTVGHQAQVLNSQTSSQNSPAMQKQQAPIPVAPQPQPFLPSQNLAALLDREPGKVLRRIPEAEYPKAIYDMSSLRAGLHLARQRSPRRVPIKIEPTLNYQHVERLIVQPTKLGVSLDLTEIKFSLSKEHLEILPVVQTHFDLVHFPVVRFENNCRRFRVRVCRFPSARAEVSESRWALASTFWPEQMQVTINSKPCLLSRKQHFHVDLPAEITTAVKAGYNEIQVSLPALSQNEGGHEYFIAVEQIITHDYATVWRSVNSNPHIAAETTKDKIKHINELPGTDEIALLGRTSHVSVCDPVSSKICATPVRGANCKHLECFDLENWLRSRPGKPKSSATEPCLVDCWDCPICGSDARPTQLRVCDYFVNVVRELRESGNSETRTIAVGENGEWRPVFERSGHCNREGMSPRSLLRRPHQIPKETEVIEILDD
ncbi:hypothetical protein NLG97_g4756 [Lecanicillium saksenae]|uniref:Uncharacterized protein n=1 Tax=Lecanicillium saksenae TaxID=468837 RepID=A0ACC1QWY9_9HYPO|nr:hypothetical protein NLG97_g4756 [Lecanicillium saksenae]